MDMTKYKLNSLCACFPIGTIWSNLSRLQRELTNMNSIKQWMCGLLLNELIELFLHPSREYFIHHAPLRGFWEVFSTWLTFTYPEQKGFFVMPIFSSLVQKSCDTQNYALICDQMISLCQKQLRYIIWL